MSFFFFFCSCLYICVLSVLSAHRVLKSAWSYRQMWGTMWVLGIKFLSSVREATALNDRPQKCVFSFLLRGIRWISLNLFYSWEMLTGVLWNNNCFFDKFLKFKYVPWLPSFLDPLFVITHWYIRKQSSLHFRNRWSGCGGSHLYYKQADRSV